MEATLRISLYSYLYFKLEKCYVFLIILMFSLQLNWKTREQNRFCPEVSGEGRCPKYTHVSKCKNDNIEERKVNKVFNRQMKNKYD
jgi:hypothetical protein